MFLFCSFFTLIQVLVSGSKLGVLRYIGETDFAKGIWAGVELSDPLGKNDGAVAGKRLVIIVLINNI